MDTLSLSNVSKEGLERLFGAREGFLFARKFDKDARVRDAEGKHVGSVEQFLIKALSLEPWPGL